MTINKKNPRRTTYYRAVHWCYNDYILCNNIERVDKSVLDNARFNFYNDEENPIEIYQWFLTSASESDVKYLEKSFGLLFTYSDMLDCYVLCVDHYGTSWHGVSCDCYNDDIADDLLKDDEEF